MSDWTCATNYIKNLFDSDHVIKLFPIKNYAFRTPYKKSERTKIQCKLNNSVSDSFYVVCSHMCGIRLFEIFPNIFLSLSF